MTRVRRETTPDQALHAKYARIGGHTDCFVTEIAHPVTHAEYVEAFYTTWLFKLERLILAWLVAKPSTDVEAREVARGERTAFAAWSVEGRAPDQLLMQDFQDKTRSWFMVEPVPGQAGSTRLYFGTGIKPITDRGTGETRLGGGFQALMGFHTLYSRALLCAARARLERGR